MLKFILIAFVAITAADPLRFGYRKLGNGRVIGGQPTTIEQVPYQISLQIYGSHICGGSIISKEWIVTAGHCSSYNANAYKIRAGSTIHSRGGSLHTVDKVIRHEKYGSDRYGHPINDIALLRINMPFIFDNTRKPIDLFEFDEESPANALSIITGWGNTGSNYPDILQTVQVPIITKRDCANSYKLSGGIPDNQICAAYDEGGKDACQGDSGGPLAIDRNGTLKLAGLTSWGRGCATAGNPGVYCEIAPYRMWIKKNSGV